MHPEESAFQAALDLSPDDFTTRLVFADWLEERGDPRADGYRALGVLRRRPMGTEKWYWMKTPMGGTLRFRRDYPWRLGAIWHRSVCIALRPRLAQFISRRQAEDAAAFGFIRLSAARRIQLLKPPNY